MQTIYYTTTNFVRHTGNVIDLNEYRRKLALVQEGSLAPQPEAEDAYDPMDGEEWERPVLRAVTPRRRRPSRAMVLDLCASLSVIVMTLTFAVRVLLG